MDRQNNIFSRTDNVALFVAVFAATMIVSYFFSPFEDEAISFLAEDSGSFGEVLTNPILNFVFMNTLFCGISDTLLMWAFPFGVAQSNAMNDLPTAGYALSIAFAILISGVCFIAGRILVHKFNEECEELFQSNKICFGFKIYVVENLIGYFTGLKRKNKIKK